MKYLIVLLFLCIPFKEIYAQNEPTTSLTISPVHLVLPFLEFTVENYRSPDTGIAFIFGAGMVEELFAYELGMQYNYYFIGNYHHGAQFGLEVLAASVSSESALHLMMGPQIGYKVITSSSFTFHIQGGYAFSSFSKHSVILNLNIGISF
ncbi:MAG TPA: hypothetical protein VEC36_00715 [Patescibacteria group bacterium]|nr:hypothetical protein [Patescibacteria group bacterium]